MNSKMLVLKPTKLINESLGLVEGNIDYGYGIDTDEMNIRLNRLSFVLSGKRKGEDSTIVIGYFNSVESLLRRVYTQEVLSYLTGDIQALNERVCSTIDTCVDSLGKLNNKKDLYKHLIKVGR